MGHWEPASPIHLQRGPRCSHGEYVASAARRKKLNPADLLVLRVALILSSFACSLYFVFGCGLNGSMSAKATPALTRSPSA